MSVLRSFLSMAGPPSLLAIAVVATWETVVRVMSIPDYLLPSPTEVLAAVADNPQRFAQATLLTAAAAGCGFAASLIVGVAIAFVFSQSSMIRRSCFPYAIFLQTVPIVAVAPLIINWFGFGFPSVVLVSLIVSLFPVITNATAGLTEIDQRLVDVFRLHRASRWQTLVKLRLPNAVPSIVTGAKVSAGLAVIGAIVGEFFAGYQGQIGLGYLVLVTSSQFKTSDLFAAVIACTLLGVTVFALISAIASTILRRWEK